MKKVVSAKRCTDVSGWVDAYIDAVVRASKAKDTAGSAIYARAAAIESVSDARLERLASGGVKVRGA